MLCVATSFPERTFTLPMSKSASATRSSRCHYLWLELKTETGVLSSSRGRICVDEETVQYRFVLPRCSAWTDGGGTPFKKLVQHINLLLNMTLRNTGSWASVQWDHDDDDAKLELSNLRTHGYHGPLGTFIFMDQICRLHVSVNRKNLLVLYLILVGEVRL